MICNSIDMHKKLHRARDNKFLVPRLVGRTQMRMSESRVVRSWTEEGGSNKAEQE
jgi:hypothetical protein